MSAKGADVPLTAYFSYARRHAPIIMLCMAAGVAVGVAVGHRVATYVGTAAVFAPPLDLGPHGLPNAGTTPFREKDAVTPDTEAQIATSKPVLNAVRAATGLRADYATLAKRVTIDAPVNTQVIAISFEARHPKAATEGAQAAAQGFIATRARLISNRKDADLAAMRAQEAALLDDLAVASKQAAGGDRLAIIQRGVLIDGIRSLRRSEARLVTAQAGAGTILRPATESALHVRLGREVPVASGMLTGLLAGLGLGRLRRRRFVSAWDLQRIDVAGGRLEVIRVAPPRGVHRLVRQRLRRSGPDVGLRRLRNATVAAGGGVTMFAGPAGAAVTAGLAGGLARSLARLDEAVAVLVSPDNPKALTALGVSAAALLDVDTSPVTGGRVAPERGDVAVYRLPTGTEATAAVAALRRSYPQTIVITYGPPDAAICAVARLADRVLVSAERRRTAVGDVVNVVRRLRIVGAPATTSLLVGATR